MTGSDVTCMEMLCRLLSGVFRHDVQMRLIVGGRMTCEHHAGHTRLEQAEHWNEK